MGSFYQHLAEVILRRYAINQAKTLRDVYHLDEAFLTVDPETRRFGYTNRERIRSMLADPERFDDLLNLFLHSTLEFTYASNQFLRLADEDVQALRQLYSAYFSDLLGVLEGESSEEAFAVALEEVVARHFTALRANLDRYTSARADSSPQGSWIYQQAVCAEYSPALQLELLGIRPEDLAEPVLDLGCGKSGRLVQYLAGRGIQAAGVDRLVTPDPRLLQADWLEMKFSPNTWGAVISHMAFSNHFIFQHLNPHGTAEAYARQYMAILGSLKPGGSFYYAPSLPFIEQFLPQAGYRVLRQPIHSPAPFPTQLKPLLQGETFSVTRVQKGG